MDAATKWAADLQCDPRQPKEMIAMPQDSSWRGRVRGWWRRRRQADSRNAQGGFLGVGFDTLHELGRRDALSNLPDDQLLLPWPTPVMNALLDEGRIKMHDLAAQVQEDLVLPKIRAAMARQRRDRVAKRIDEGLPDASGTAEAALAEFDIAQHAVSAAEVHLATVHSVHKERVQQVRAATNARLKAVWAANLAHRDDAGRLLISGLDVPGLEQSDDDEDGE